MFRSTRKSTATGTPLVINWRKQKRILKKNCSSTRFNRDSYKKTLRQAAKDFPNLDGAKYARNVANWL